MTFSIRPRTAVLGLAVSVIAAAPAYSKPASVDGAWDVTGEEGGTSYRGTITIKEAADGSVAIASDCKLASGSALKWSGSGTRSGDTITFKISKSTLGIAHHVLFHSGGKGSGGHGSYAIAADGKSISGSWKLDKGNVSATESLTLHAPAASGGVSVTFVEAGKETKEAVVPVRCVPGSDDVIDLKLAKVANAPADAKLELTLSSATCALFADAALTKAVSPSTSLPNEDATLKVKGVAASAPGEPTLVTARLKGADGKVLGEDVAKLWVTRSAFLLSGHGDFELGSTIKGWLAHGHSRDSRSNPSIVLGADQSTRKPVYYSVYFLDTDDGAKIALSTEGSVVAYHGHSNFGLGYAFHTGFKRISEFFNIADPQVPVNWQYLREHQEHPDLMIEDSEYGDDASTPEFSDPIQESATCPGVLKTYDRSWFPTSGGNGTRLHLTRDASQKFLDHHYGSPDNWRIVVKAGSADMPEKKWSRLLLLSCYSGPYYCRSFGGRGTLFYTWDEALCASSAASIFLEDMMVGKSNDDTLKDLNKIENIHDYHQFDSN